jgi:redox-sensitive bicupin YhaK (pirin superfamily)
MKGIEAVISAREKDLGGFVVRRILPYEHCMIGPFIFFDHMGPAHFSPGQGIEVRPHPHIHLATVTYLFEGKIRHRDSLGSNQIIEPGAINWMVAGEGIVHSERTPPEILKTGGSVNGIQCWIALPEDKENISPSFTHFAKEELPEFNLEGVQLKLLLGTAFDRGSPVPLLSDLFYVEAKFPKGARLTFPVGKREVAAYVVAGKVLIDKQEVAHCSMAVGTSGENLDIEALEDSHLMFLGGKPVGQRFIYWNFVSSSKENIEQAMLQWNGGPKESGRFLKIPGDDQEFIPLPETPPDINPKGTIM